MSDFNSEFEDHNVVGPNIMQIILRDYLPYWPVVFAAAIIGYLSGKVYLRYQRPVYSVSAAVLLKNDAESTDNLVKQAVLGQGSTKIEDQLEVLKGSKVMTKAAELSNAFYEIKWQGQFNHYYSYKWFQPIDFVFLNTDSIKGFSAKFNVNENCTEVVLDGNERFPIGRVIDFKGNRVIIKRINPEFNYKKVGYHSFDKISLTVFDKESAAARLGSSFNAEKNKKNSQVKLSLNTDMEQRGRDWLNAIIEAYQLESQADKRKKAQFTMDFIDSRLAYVGQDLDSVERRLENFKSKNDVQLVSAEAQRFLAKVQTGDQKSSELDLQLMVLDDLEKYVQGKIKKPGMAPYSAGMTQIDLNSNFKDLIQLEREYAILAETNGPKSDVVVAAKKEIDATKTMFLEIIRNTRSSINLLKNRAERDFGKYNSEYNALMRSIPNKERQLLNITRQQEIKNSLYTYLLERREEAAISSAGTLSDLTIIEPAESDGKISPKESQIQGGFTLGLVALVLVILFGKSALNNKVMGKEDIESRTKVPVLAEIIQVDGDSPLVMKDGNRSLIAEQFRGLRTSLGYLGDGSGKTKILVSSSVPGEGKSFVSTNIAISYSLTGKRTVLLESDLRKPNISMI